jgi:hypothetical protein
MSLNACTLLYRVTNTGVPQQPFRRQDLLDAKEWRMVHTCLLPNGDHLVNAMAMIEGDTLLHSEYSRLMHQAYLTVLDHWHWLQTLPPGKSRWNQQAGPKGYATWAIAGVAPRLGVRETRRILGDYVLTERDCLAGLRNQEHDDIIAITDHPVDLHGNRGRLHQVSGAADAGPHSPNRREAQALTGYELPNGAYGVPYRCLLPRGTHNLAIASRAASFSHIAASSCRLARTVVTLGQAAGTAAAMCIEHHIPLGQVDATELRSRLQSQGVTTSSN